jgi:molybdopterin synthase sulfur carrier subunit
MPRVVFTSNLQRHVDCPERTVNGTTVRAALEEVFAPKPAAKSGMRTRPARRR